MNETPTNYSMNVTMCSHSKWCYIILQKIEAFYILGSLHIPLECDLHIQISMHVFIVLHNL